MARAEDPVWGCGLALSGRAAVPDSGPSAQNAHHQHGQGDRRLCVAPVDVSQKCKVPLYPTPTLMSHWGLFELIRELWEEICCESLPAPELKHCRAEHPPPKNAICTGTGHVGHNSPPGTAALCHAQPSPGRAQHRFLGEANFPLCSAL